jgi:hypothetical protein
MAPGLVLTLAVLAGTLPRTDADAERGDALVRIRATEPVVLTAIRTGRIELGQAAMAAFFKRIGTRRLGLAGREQFETDPAEQVTALVGRELQRSAAANAATQGLVRKVAVVRPVSPTLAEAVVDGRRRSGTFNELMDRLERSDLIVYLRLGSCPDPQSVACLSMIGATSSNRFVRITFVMQMHGVETVLAVFTDHLIAQIGHELQHALEIADDPAVVDSLTLEAAYRRSGFRPDPRTTTYETTKAMAAGRSILNELHRRHATSPIAASVDHKTAIPVCTLYWATSRSSREPNVEIAQRDAVPETARDDEGSAFIRRVTSGPFTDIVANPGVVGAAERDALAAAVALVPRAPVRIAVVDAMQNRPTVRDYLLTLDAFTVEGNAVIYVVQQSQLLKDACAGSALYRAILATVLWHEMAHLSGADERGARQAEEKLWMQFVRDGVIDQVTGLRYLQALRMRPDDRLLASR